MIFPILYSNIREIVFCWKISYCKRISYTLTPNRVGIVKAGFS